MNCDHKNNFSTQARSVIFGDSNHLNNEIIQVVSEFIAENDIDNLMLELPAEITDKFRLASRKERINILENWSALPSEMMILIESAEAKGVNVIFADSMSNILAARNFYDAYSQDPFGKGGRELIALRVESNQRFAQQMQSLPHGERNVLFIGLGHISGSNDINNIVGDGVETVSIFQTPWSQSRIESGLQAQIDDFEWPDKCVYIDLPDSATIPMVTPKPSDHTSQSLNSKR